MLQETSRLATKAAGQDRGVPTPGDSDQVTEACSQYTGNFLPGMEILPIGIGLPLWRKKANNCWQRWLQALAKKGEYLFSSKRSAAVLYHLHTILPGLL